MPRVSAGILLVRDGPFEVLLAHPGGPFWVRRDTGAWTIPKGELEPGETPRAAALREFAEETGWHVSVELHDLGTVRQKSGKLVHGFAAVQNVDPAALSPHRIEIEWPPRSGRRIEIPEVDRVAWFNEDSAAVKMNPAQVPFLERARRAVGL